VVGGHALEALPGEAAEQAVLCAFGGQRVVRVFTEEGLADEVAGLADVDKDLAAARLRLDQTRSR